MPTINSRCIKFRLISDAGMTAEDYSFPREIIEMVLNKKYFFDIKTRLDEEIKDKEGALRFLDGIQKTFGIFLRETAYSVRHVLLTVLTAWKRQEAI